MDSYECDGCGACCRTLPIFASAADAAREARIDREARRLPASLATPEWRYQLYPLPFLEACSFLDSDNRCAIYATRPAACASFPAGGEQCQLVRQRRGLPPLLPVSEPGPGERPSS
jgi:uncharacterized protein